MNGDWIQFANLETQHFFERFGEVLDETSICKRASITSGPMIKVWDIKQKNKPKCRVCVNIYGIRERAKSK